MTIDIKEILEMKTPVNLGEEIIDLALYEEIFADGHYSDTGVTIYANSKEDLIEYTWSRWQGDSSTYSRISLTEYLNMILGFRDEDHFLRGVEGLRRLFN